MEGTKELSDKKYILFGDFIIYYKDITLILITIALNPLNTSQAVYQDSNCVTKRRALGLLPLRFVVQV